MKPVTLPPGRARLSTKPPPTGSEAIGNTIGTMWVSCNNGRTVEVPWATITSGSECDQIRRVSANIAGVSRSPADVDPHVAAGAPTQLLQLLQARRNEGLKLWVIRACGQHYTNAPSAFALLRAHQRRFCYGCRRATEKRDEIAPPHCLP